MTEAYWSVLADSRVQISAIQRGFRGAGWPTLPFVRMAESPGLEATSYGLSRNCPASGYKAVATSLAEACLQVCEFVDEMLSWLLPTMFYCQLKYSELSQLPGCLQDPLCDYDYLTLSCSAHDDISKRAVIKGFEVGLPQSR